MRRLSILILALAPSVTYIAPTQLPAPQQSNPAEVLYGCPTGVLGRWVDNDSRHKERVDKHFEPSRVKSFDSHKVGAMQQHWVCRVVTK